MKAQILCRSEVLARAISSTSTPTRRTITTDLGWDERGDVYRTPSVRIDADGIHPTSEDDPVRVELGGEEATKRLDLVAPLPGEVESLKRHIVEDLLRLAQREVIYSMLGAVALAVLFQFVVGMNRPAIWLVGITGAGKSFLARLFANFFGDFPIELGTATGSWTSTVNFLQRLGFFFKDSLYLVDDYKPDVTRPHDATRLLQNYADNSARGRLNADATANVSRPIRGILVSTGESVPDQSASAMARTIVLRPRGEKDVERGGRCLGHRPRYRALMADFIRHLIVQGRGQAFAARVLELQGQLYRPIAGVQNDLRIAGNLALIGAASEEFAAYLADAQPVIDAEVNAYISEDLPALRDEMVRETRGAQSSEIFLETLAVLVRNRHFEIKDLPGYAPDSHTRPEKRIGRYSKGCLEIVTELALAGVQDCLARQARPRLATNSRELLEQLHADNKLLPPPERIKLKSPGRKTYNVRLDNQTCHAFRISPAVLLGSGWQGSGRSVRQDPAG